MEQKIKIAVDYAVAAEQQPPELSTKINAWLEELIDGSEDIAHPPTYMRRINLCFDTIILPPSDDE